MSQQSKPVTFSVSDCVKMGFYGSLGAFLFGVLASGLFFVALTLIGVSVSQFTGAGGQ